MDRKGKEQEKTDPKTGQVHDSIMRHSPSHPALASFGTCTLTVTAPVHMLSAAGSSPASHFISHNSSNSQISTGELGLPGARPINIVSCKDLVIVMNYVGRVPVTRLSSSLQNLSYYSSSEVPHLYIVPQRVSNTF